MRRGRNNWTSEDDTLLRVLFIKHRDKRNPWRIISNCFPKQTSKACRERWVFHVDPKINHSPLTSEEARYILSHHLHYSNSKSWVEIAKKLSSPYSGRRTALQCKNFVNNRQRRIDSAIERLASHFKCTGNRLSLGFILNNK